MYDYVFVPVCMCGDERERGSNINFNKLLIVLLSWFKSRKCDNLHFVYWVK